MKIPINLTELECSIERLVRKHHAKLSELFIIVNAPDEGEIKLELPDSIIRNLKESLSFDRDLAILSPKTRGESLSHLIDTNKIRVFYLFYAPKNLVLWNKKFNYPQVSKVSAKPFKGKDAPLIYKGFDKDAN